ncbi:MAG: universal stress protein [Acidobacteriaceae bacterium]|jgi:nucleotide-binding universal stress UspA family protein
MKVLMGIDDSKYAAEIARAFVAQFRAENTDVLVLHVLQPLGLMAPPEMAMGYAPELEEMKKPAQELVERVAMQLRGAGFKAETAVEVGDVRERILDSASEWRADLIVLGSHGKRGLQRFLLGSVAEFVARHARCSVHIIRTPAGN